MKRMVALSFFVMLSAVVYSQDFRQIRECVLENGVAKEIVVDYNPATGEKTIVVGGVRKDFEKLQELNPEYAAKKEWYQKSEVVKIGKASYQKYGLPRILGTSEIVKFTNYAGIGLFREQGTTGRAEVIYVPVRAGCEFQPYELILPDCGTIQLTPNVDSIAKGTSLTLKAVVPGKPGTLSYSWSMSGGDVTSEWNQQTVTVKPAPKARYFTVSLYVKSETCRGSVTKTIDIFE